MEKGEIKALLKPIRHINNSKTKLPKENFNLLWINIISNYRIKIIWEVSLNPPFGEKVHTLARWICNPFVAHQARKKQEKVRKKT